MAEHVPGPEPTIIEGTEVTLQVKRDGEWADVTAPRVTESYLDRDCAQGNHRECAGPPCACNCHWSDPEGYDEDANAVQDDEAVVWGPM